MTARQEKVREALEYDEKKPWAPIYRAALAEVEEWEAEVQRLGDDVAEQALRIIDLGQKENEAVARAEAAEADADRLKAALEASRQDADLVHETATIRAATLQAAHEATTKATVARAAAAEAEADRLKDALRDAEFSVRRFLETEQDERFLMDALAALAPADRNTT